jgi:hypothetical protein
MQSPESPAFVRPAKFATVVNGDLWQLGKHRLACGDATDSAIVSKLLGHARPRLMATDPPYGVGYEPEWRRKLKDSASIVRHRQGAQRRSQRLARGLEAFSRRYRLRLARRPARELRRAEPGGGRFPRP